MLAIRKAPAAPPRSGTEYNAEGKGTLPLTTQSRNWKNLPPTPSDRENSRQVVVESDPQISHPKTKQVTMEGVALNTALGKVAVKHNNERYAKPQEGQAGSTTVPPNKVVFIVLFRPYLRTLAIAWEKKGKKLSSSTGRKRMQRVALGENIDGAIFAQEKRKARAKTKQIASQEGNFLVASSATLRQRSRQEWVWFAWAGSLCTVRVFSVVLLGCGTSVDVRYLRIQGVKYAQIGEKERRKKELRLL